MLSRQGRLTMETLCTPRNRTSPARSTTTVVLLRLGPQAYCPRSSAMRVVVFGASGATGRELVSQALVQGHRVTAFVRNRSQLDSRTNDVIVVQGDLIDLAPLSQAPSRIRTPCS